MAKAMTPPDKVLDGDSANWKNWMSELSPTTCEDCVKLHGKIYPMKMFVPLPLHINGKCKVVPMRTKVAGTATNMGQNGVDVYLLEHGKLPGYFINKKHAEKQGWVKKDGNLAEVLPGRMIGGDIYNNRNGLLPQSNGRGWIEADFDYISGYRNDCRILCSTDGLIFVTYDHYQTFYEITP